ncbi:glycosyl transferase [Sphingobacteriales bacterium UPWRP_1]|nr:hypothetical protein B6N25_12050 [Sphingobacteriales bacterium TSM_CSS]PSJ77149.1 glycosyl transferase [Sphingobacteriales bacterium UPWRP_1]
MYVAGWLCLPAWRSLANEAPKTPVSVIIPARNEQAHIVNCLRAVMLQQYPPHLLEIIVVDDHSDDNTAVLAEEMAQQCPQIKVLHLTDFMPHEKPVNAYKKKAIETGIRHSSNPLIVTTDADCFAAPQWLATLVGFYEQYHPQLIAAPVCFTNERTFFERFQTLDFMGMMVTTGAMAYLQTGNMCNGANLAYTRQAFETVGGFKDIDHLASGDDMLLMSKIARKYPGGVRFLKNYRATVFTGAQPTLQAFVNQRVRWASKSGHYPDTGITASLIVVFLFNFLMIFNFIACLLGALNVCRLVTLQFTAKCIADFIYLSVGARFFGRCKLLWLFLPAQLPHILYIAVIGIWGNLGQYSWKGRTVK